MSESRVVPVTTLRQQTVEQWRKGYEYSEDTPLHRQHYWDGYNNGRRECAIQLDALLVSTRPREEKKNEDLTRVDGERRAAGPTGSTASTD